MASIKVKLRKSGKHVCKGTLFIQMISKRKVRVIKTPFKVYDHEWDTKNERVRYNYSSRQRLQYLKEIQAALDAEIIRLEGVVRTLEMREMDTVKEILNCFHNHTLSVNLFTFMEQLAVQMKFAGQSKSAIMVNTVKISLAKFLGRSDVKLSLLDASMMKQYEQHLQRTKLTPNSTSCYMRVLRSVYNKAVEEGLSPQRIPFKKVYTGIAKTGKRSVDESTIHSLIQFDLSKHPHLAFARDMFMFSFYTRGMSFVDMANLTHENISDGYINYGRSKTGTLLSIKIEPCIEDITKRYEKDSVPPYVLPLRVPGSTDPSNRLRVQNKRLIRISQLMGLKNHLTSYTARHSWATIALRCGVPVRVISESLGHSNERTTQIYLASFEQSVLDLANADVLKFFS